MHSTDGIIFGPILPYQPHHVSRENGSYHKEPAIKNREDACFEKKLASPYAGEGSVFRPVWNFWYFEYLPFCLVMTPQILKGSENRPFSCT
jgi:hypothetical protein